MPRLLMLVVLNLLAGCNRPADVPVALDADPERLHALHRQCAAVGYKDRYCAKVEQAELDRFLSGQSTAEEYRSLAQLPAIPASFDAPQESDP